MGIGTGRLGERRKLRTMSRKGNLSDIRVVEWKRFLFQGELRQGVDILFVNDRTGS